MEIKEVDEMPTNYRQLNKDHTELLQALEGLQEGKVLQIEVPKDREPKNMLTGFRHVAKRLQKTFKFRIVEGKIYVTQKKKENEKETEETKKTGDTKTNNTEEKTTEMKNKKETQNNKRQ